METLQNLLTPFTTAWYQADSHQLISFAILFAALWLIAAVVEAAAKKATRED